MSNMSTTSSVARVPVCVATDDGRLWHPSCLGIDDVLSTVRQCFMQGDVCDEFNRADFTAVELVMLNDASPLSDVEFTCNTILVYELPASRVIDSHDTKAYAHMRDLLKKRDAIELVASRRSNGDRIIAVHVNFYTSDTEHHEDTYMGILRELTARSVAQHLSNELRMDRTGTGTVSVFGRQFRFDLSNNGVPLLTTKKMQWRKVVEELLWFARGETDVAELQKRGVHIWDGNSSRGFLDSVGLESNRVGDIGPAYGFQWRHYGAEYVGPKSGDASMYASQGVDQLARVEHLLKTDPFSRRIVMTAWNPVDVGKMALPPCHVMVQFYVDDSGGERRLSCHMYQRSVDTFLGFPWNIASYAILTHLLAMRSSMSAAELIISTGDTHLYSDHVDAAVRQLDRAPLPMPRVVIDPSVAFKEWHEIEVDADVSIVGYYSHPPITARMSA